MYILGAIFCFCATFLVDVNEGLVEIQKPYHPYYVKAGDTLKLLCNSTERRELQWVHRDPKDNWQLTVIDPVQQRDAVIRSCEEEPSGNVESTLYMRHVSLDDRGMYKCQDVLRENSYDVWITVLHMRSENVTAKKDEPVTMYCKISGIAENPPMFEYAWYYEELFIPRDHPRYYMTRLNSSFGASLTIHQPMKQDIGRYNCVFKFSLNIGEKELIHSAYLTGDSLPTSSASWPTASVLLLLSVILASVTAVFGVSSYGAVS